MVKRYIPDRGDVVWVNLNPVVGHEQANERPAVVLTTKEYNQLSGLLIACPVTAKVKGYVFEIPLTGKKIQGVVLTDQIRSLDWRQREVRFIEKTPAATTLAIVDNVRLLLE